MGFWIGIANKVPIDEDAAGSGQHLRTTVINHAEPWGTQSICYRSVELNTPWVQSPLFLADKEVPCHWPLLQIPQPPKHLEVIFLFMSFLLFMAVVPKPAYWNQLENFEDY